MHYPNMSIYLGFRKKREIENTSKHSTERKEPQRSRDLLQIPKASHWVTLGPSKGCADGQESQWLCTSPPPHMVTVHLTFVHLTFLQGKSSASHTAQLRKQDSQCSEGRAKIRTQTDSLCALGTRQTLHCTDRAQLSLGPQVLDRLALAVLMCTAGSKAAAGNTAPHKSNHQEATSPAQPAFPR